MERQITLRPVGYPLRPSCRLLDTFACNLNGAFVHRMPGQSHQRLCRLGSFDQNLICAMSGIVPPKLVDEHELQVLMKIDGKVLAQIEHPKLEVRNVCCRLLC